MGSGFAGIKQAQAEIESRRGSGGRGSFFKLADKESATVRFLEQGDDVKWCWAHEVRVPNRQYPIFIPCIDQNSQGDPCPGCERDIKRKVRGYINLIWRNAPKLKRDDQGNAVKDGSGSYVFEGTADQVAVWEAGIQVFDDLGDKDVKYKGLMSRDFEVTRKGTGLNTKYTIEPADVDGGAKEMSDADIKLAEEKPDLGERVQKPGYQDFLRRLSGDTSNGGGSQPSGTDGPNPFLRD